MLIAYLNPNAILNLYFHDEPNKAIITAAKDMLLPGLAAGAMDIIISGILSPVYQLMNWQLYFMIGAYLSLGLELVLTHFLLAANFATKYIFVSHCALMLGFSLLSILPGYLIFSDNPKFRS